MAFAVLITNPEQIAYYTQETALRLAETTRNTARDVAAGVQIALQTAQLIAYYDAADDAIDARDDKIDAQITFMQTLENLNINQDLPMINCKRDVLVDLVLPEEDTCGVRVEHFTYWFFDGRSIDNKSRDLVDESCGGLPNGWSLHEGQVNSGRSESSAGALMSASGKRRIEQFRRNKTTLVRSAHSGLKSVFNAGDTLSKYAQAAAIHSGLADLYIQGFNSAGAALGVAINSLTSGTVTPGSAAPVNTTGASTGSASGTLGPPSP